MTAHYITIPQCSVTQDYKYNYEDYRDTWEMLRMCKKYEISCKTAGASTKSVHT